MAVRCDGMLDRDFISFVFGVGADATDNYFRSGTSRQSMNLRPIMTSRHSQREHPAAVREITPAREARNRNRAAPSGYRLPETKRRRDAAACGFAEHRFYRPAMM